MSQTETQTETVNGEKPTSLTVNHLTSYPLPADLLALYTSHPLGAKSINLLNNLYASLTPYLSTPLSILHPYLEQADRVGNSTLSHLDERFPAIKETDLEAVRSRAANLAGFPLKLVGETRSYVLNAYGDEYEKVGGQDGLLRHGKAIVSTEMRIACEGFYAVAEWLGPKRKEAGEKYAQLREQAGGEYEKMKAFGVEKMKQGTKIVERKLEEMEKVGKEKKDEVMNGQ